MWNEDFRLFGEVITVDLTLLFHAAVRTEVHWEVGY